MSLLFGTYFKEGIYEDSIVNNGYKDFTHNNKRHTITYKFSNFRLDLAPLWSNPEHCYLNKDNIHIWVSGDINAIENYGTYINSKKNDFLGIFYNSYLNSDFSFLHYLSGEFTIVIFDALNQKLFIANDLFGLYPLFIYDFGKYFVFSNEYEPIVRLKGFKKDLDYQAIYEYFSLGFSLKHNTFFQGLTNLEPAHLLQIEMNHLHKIKYQETKININYNTNPDIIAKDIAEIMTPVVDKIIHSTENAVCTLTGGLDTRLVLSNISQELRNKLDFITISTPNLPDEADKDILIAKEISKKLKLKHSITFFPSWHIQYDKEFDISFYDIWREKADKRGITGLYGTELLNGGWIDMMPEILRKKISMKKSTSFIDKFIKTKSDSIKTIFSKGFLKNVDSSNQELERELNGQICEHKYYKFAIDHISRGFFTYFHSGTRNKWHHTHDLITNVVTPFSDKTMLEYFLSIPMEYLIDSNFRIYNKLYKNHFPELTNIPTTSKFGLIPGNCIPFLNKGKDPLHERKWNYHKINNHVIHDDLTWESNLYNKEKTLKIIKNNPDVLNKLVDFEVWLRNFVYN